MTSIGLDLSLPNGRPRCMHAKQCTLPAGHEDQCNYESSGELIKVTFHSRHEDQPSEVWFCHKWEPTGNSIILYDGWYYKRNPRDSFEVMVIQMWPGDLVESKIMKDADYEIIANGEDKWTGDGTSSEEKPSSPD